AYRGLDADPRPGLREVLGSDDRGIAHHTRAVAGRIDERATVANLPRPGPVDVQLDGPERCGRPQHRPILTAVPGRHLGGLDRLARGGHQAEARRAFDHLERRHDQALAEKEARAREQAASLAVEAL